MLAKGQEILYGPRSETDGPVHVEDSHAIEGGATVVMDSLHVVPGGGGWTC